MRGAAAERAGARVEHAVDGCPSLSRGTWGRAAAGVVAVVADEEVPAQRLVLRGEGVERRHVVVVGQAVGRRPCPRTPPAERRGSPPASSSSTLQPGLGQPRGDRAAAGARADHDVVEVAVARLARATARPGLEGLQELDQVALLRVGEARLLGEPVGAEVVAAVDHEVLALAELEHRLDQVRERLPRLLVAGVLRASTRRSRIARTSSLASLASC